MTPLLFELFAINQPVVYFVFSKEHDDARLRRLFWMWQTGFNVFAVLLIILLVVIFVKGKLWPSNQSRAKFHFISWSNRLFWFDVVVQIWIVNFSRSKINQTFKFDRKRSTLYQNCLKLIKKVKFHWLFYIYQHFGSFNW